MIKGIIRLIKKDCLIELRSRASMGVSLSFAAVSTLSISMSGAGTAQSAGTHAVLLWLVIFFSAMSGLAGVFSREEEEGTVLFLKVHSSPLEVYFSKLIFNAVFLVFLQLAICPLFIFFMQIQVQSLWLFCALMACGGAAISAVSTFLGAIAARAHSGAALFTVLSFPLLMPALTAVIISTEKALLGSNPGGEYGTIVFLLAFTGIIISVSILLFEYLWRE